MQLGEHGMVHEVAERGQRPLELAVVIGRKVAGEAVDEERRSILGDVGVSYRKMEIKRVPRAEVDQV